MSLIISVGIGAGIGALLGYFGQCSSGTCPLTSTWWRGSLYGAVLGLVVHTMSGGGRATQLNQSTSNVVKISEQEFTQEVLRSDQPVAVDFFATWCGPCKAMAPVIEEVAGEFAGKVRFVKVNVDEAPALARQYEIQGIPTLVLFQNGQPVDSRVGMVSREELVKRLHAALDKRQTAMEKAVLDGLGPIR